MWWILLACSGAEGELPGACIEDALYGQPTAATGLGDDQCAPSCPCTGLDAPELSPTVLRAHTLLDTPVLLDVDPYDTPEQVLPREAGDCVAVAEDGGGYRLQTVLDADPSAMVTHEGACGACSSLHDLAVYAEQIDLTQPVRQCGLDHGLGAEQDHQACLEDIGFTPACAQIWMFNSRHTQSVCLVDCLSLLDAPYHEEDGSLNACLQCDEDNSGDVFKAVAGRTRRNSGLASALCRPCETVAPLRHDYPAP